MRATYITNRILAPITHISLPLSLPHLQHHHAVERQTYIQSRPKKGQSHRQLLRLIEISREENRTRDKPSLERTNKRSRHVERCPAGHPRLRPGNQTPSEHHDRQDALEAESLD